MSMILYLSDPRGATTSTVSPFLRPRMARPTGDSFESFCSAGFASADPTIVYSIVSLASTSRRRTIVPTLTTSVVTSFASMTRAAFSRSWSVAIRCSSIACSFLASSYSEFSAMSPNSRASLMRSATSRRLTVERCSMSVWSLSSPSLVIGISRATCGPTSSSCLGTNAARQGRRLTSRKPPDTHAIRAHGVGQARNYSGALRPLNGGKIERFQLVEQLAHLVQRGRPLVGVRVPSVYPEALEIPRIELPQVPRRPLGAPVLCPALEDPAKLGDHLAAGRFLVPP